MTVKKTLIALVALLFAAVAFAEYQVEYYVLATADPTWVRTSPGLGDNIVDKLTPDRLYEWGGHVEVDNRGVDWYDVYYDSGKYGWISGLHGNLVNQYGQPYTDHSVSLGKGTSIRADVDVDVRSDAGDRCSGIGVLLAGDTADYTGTSKKDSKGQTWYQINFHDRRGWVPARYTHIDNGDAKAGDVYQPYLLQGDGYSIQLLSLELVSPDRGEEYLQANVWVHNTTDYELEISTDDLYLNGVELYGGGLRNCGSGDYPWSFEIWYEDYTRERWAAIHNPETLTVTLDVCEGYNWSRLMTRTVTLPVQGLLR